MKQKNHLFPWRLATIRFTQVQASLILATLILTACTKETAAPNENHKFELSCAKDWTLVNQQGNDSYVGYYQKWADRINFDFGFLAFQSVDSIKQTPQMLYFETTVINGSDAKIFKEVRSDGIRLSAFIDKRDGKHKTWLYTYNPKDDRKFISIFKSHKFK